MRQIRRYGWEHETVDERPSEFMPSVGYACLSAYETDAELRRAARARAGLKRLVLCFLITLALGGWAIWEWVPLLGH